jgi:phosphohistidine phosphatase
MQLLIVRHADAGDREEFARTGQSDSERPLSAKGKAQMDSVAPALVGLMPEVGVILSSPYTRARQTAEILRQAWKAGPLEETDTLQPEMRPSAFGKYLAEREEDVVVCVGHEPQLSALAAWLTTGSADSYMDFRKAGACLVEFDDAPAKGAGLLRWLFGPRELKALK